jgi:hypothetical protein
VLAAFAASGAHSGGTPWVEYATFALVLVGVIVTFCGWVRRNYFGFEIWWTDDSAEPEVEHRRAELVRIGERTLLYIRLRPRVSVELTRIDVRLQDESRHWEWRQPRHLRFPRHIRDATRPEVIRVTELRDGNYETFSRGGGRSYPRTLSSSLNRRDKSLLIGEYSPPWSVPAGDAIILWVTVEAYCEWTGRLTVSIPNAATGRRVWKRLPLAAVTAE